MMRGVYPLAGVRWWTRAIRHRELGWGHTIDGIHVSDFVWLWRGPDALEITGNAPDPDDLLGEAIIGVALNFRGCRLGGVSLFEEILIPGLACATGWPSDLLALLRGDGHPSTELELVVDGAGEFRVDGILLDGVET
jgi:hypothetical protein